MENNLAATQPEQSTAAPTTADSAPASTDEGSTSAPAPVNESKGEREPEWYTKRIDEITAKRYAELREADERYQTAARERDELRAQLQSREAQNVDLKTLADFDYDEKKFQSYVVELARKEAREAASQVNHERDAQNSEQLRRQKFKEREIEFERANKDYRDVAHYAPVSKEVAHIVMDLETGPEIAYYLGKNTEIAKKLNDLPKHIAAVEIGRIEAKLSAERKAKAEALEKAKAEKAVSRAPAPTPSIDGSGEPGHVKPDEPDSDKLSDAEWTRRRNKQLAKKRS